MLLTLVVAPGSADARASVARTSLIPAAPVPPGCGAGQSESTPQVAVRPGKPQHLAAVVLVDGGNVTTGARSRDGGRSWKPGVVPASTACVDGPPERSFTVNPRVALGAGGLAWHGASWAGQGGGLFRFGMEANPSVDGGATWSRGPRPAGDGQDLVVVPDATRPRNAALIWLHHDQAPNPLTYLPSGMDMRFAQVRQGDVGEIPGEPVYEPPEGQLLDDPKVVRTTSGALLALVSQASLGDLAATFNPATANDPVRFRGLAMRSEDFGETWSEPVEAGAPVLFTHTHEESETTFHFGLSDLAAGPRNRAAMVWAEPATGDQPGGLAIHETSDAGKSWRTVRPAGVSAPLVFTPAIAFGRDGTRALFWYDNRNDRPGDKRLDVDAWAQVKRPGRRAKIVHLAGPFDMVPLRSPPAYAVDGNALGVVQDAVPLSRGRFGFAYTVPSPGDGVTDTRFTVVRAGR